MRWNTHRALGVFSYTVTIVFMPCLQVNPLSSLGLITAYAGATLPDCVEPKNAHRTYGHSMIYACIFCCFAYVIGRLMWPLEGLAYGYICGVCTHLIADAFTDNGIPMFWPLEKKRINPGKLRLWYYDQGKSAERTISMVVWLMTAVVWLKLFPLVVTRWLNVFFY